MNGAALTTTKRRLLPMGLPHVRSELAEKGTQSTPRRCHQLTGEQRRLLYIFEASGIAAIPFKGPALA